KQQYLRVMFVENEKNTPEIRFKSFNDVWEQRKLGEVGETFSGLSGKKKADFGHGEARFVTYSNIFGNAISDPNNLDIIEIDNKQNQVQYGDVFFTTSSETPKEVGMSSVWLEDTNNVYLNSFCFGYRPIITFDPYYLAFMLRSPSIRKKLIFLAQGISRYNISKKKVMEIGIPTPSTKEQQKIGSFFKELDDTIELHYSKLEKLNKIKQVYLNKMFI
ncbi:restriction endonuclease subunit S, partial [Salinicoccus halodurans]